METKAVHTHFALFKPYGYLSQFESNANHERNKKFLGSLFDFPSGTMAIGRLDKNSEGLLLLTTDGKISAHINSQKFEKEYYAQVDGLITEDTIEGLRHGLDISVDGLPYFTKPINVFKIEGTPRLPERSKNIRDDRHGPTSWVSITINEGKFHHIRKMTSAIGFPTLRLVRVRVHSIGIETMQPGDVIEFKRFFD